MHKVLILAAKQVAKTAFEWASKYTIYPEIVSDRAAVKAVLRFLGDHRCCGNSHSFWSLSAEELWLQEHCCMAGNNFDALDFFPRENRSELFFE
ncbi:MAG: hypothetical protein S4CHLAM2_07550 [Chlamydiales bacterium]|nr:hypothetical protein [Chlamydiales bacterium]